MVWVARCRRALHVGSFGNVVGVLIGVIFLLPMLWLLITSLSPLTVMGKYPPALLPPHPTLSNFVSTFANFHFQTYLLTSVIVCSASTFFVIVFGSAAAYALARTEMRGKYAILIALLVVSTFPVMSIITPLYTIYKTVGLLNTYEALVIPYTALSMPFSVWLMRNYFIRIPFEMEEQGQVDGASAVRIVYSVILPQALPGIFVAATLAFAGCWQDFLICLSFNNSSHYQNVAVGIDLMTTYAGVPYPTVFAASLIALAPIIVLVLIMRNWIIGGGIQGAVKG